MAAAMRQVDIDLMVALVPFKFLSWLFGHVAKQLDEKDKVVFRFYDVTAWLTNKSYYTYWPIYQEVKGIRQWNLLS